MPTVEEITANHLPENAAPTLAWIIEFEHWLRRKVYYLHDHENTRIGKPLDEWRTLLPEILRRLERRGPYHAVGDDCDAWSYTSVDGCLFAGVREEDVRLLIVNSWLGQIRYDLGKQREPLDHMIAAVRVEGRWYVIGDTFRVGPYPAEECEHKLYQAHRLPIRQHDFYDVAGWDEL